MITYEDRSWDFVHMLVAVCRRQVLLIPFTARDETAVIPERDNGTIKVQG